MSSTLELQELVIVITAKNYDPSLLNPGFLKYSGIVPEGWELAKKPINSNRISQVIFDNSVYILAQPNRLIFGEACQNKAEINSAEIPTLARRYVEILRNIEYQSIGINYRGYVICTNVTVDSNRYIFDNLIRPGEWQNCGTDSVKAEVNLRFPYDEKQLNLSISEAALKLPESEEVPIVLFNGNFNYNLTTDSSENRLSQLGGIFDNWQQDLDIYQDVVSKLINTDSGEGSEFENNREPVAV